MSNVSVCNILWCFWGIMDGGVTQQNPVKKNQKKVQILTETQLKKKQKKSSYPY